MSYLLKSICLRNGLFCSSSVFLSFFLIANQVNALEANYIPPSPPLASPLPGEKKIVIPPEPPNKANLESTGSSSSSTSDSESQSELESKSGLESKSISENSNFLASNSSHWATEGGFGIKVYVMPSASYTKNTFNGTYLNVSAQHQMNTRQVGVLKANSPQANPSQPNLPQVNTAAISSEKTYSLFGSLDFFDKTDNLSGHFYPTLRDIYWKSLNHEQSRVLRIGYFLSPMIERERQFWKGYLLGKDRSGLWERYAYLKTTEAGIEYGSVDQSIQWRIGFMNTDAEKADPMIQKDVIASLELLPSDGRSFFAGICFQKGWYEGLPIKLNNKDRGFFWLGQQIPDGLSWTIELFNALDAVDGIKKPVAESIDLIQRGGQLVHAHATALSLGQNFENFGRKFRIDLRIDDFDPDLEQKFNSLQSNTLIISVPQDIGHMSLSLENLYLQKNHSIGSKLRSTVRLDYVFQL